MVRRIRRILLGSYPILIILIVYFSVPKGPPDTIRQDAVGYHLWTYAILRGDFNFANYRDLDQNSIVEADPERGYFHNKYGPGVALVQLPVMVFVADSSSLPPAISPAEHRACRIMGLLALLVIVFIMMRAGRGVGLPKFSTNLAVLAIVFGTGLFHYAVYEPGASHIWSALGLTVFFGLTLRGAIGKSGRVGMVMTVLVAALLVLIRNTNLIAIIFLTVLAVVGKVKRKGGLRPALMRIALPATIGTLVGLGMQIYLNSHAHHRFVLSAYSEEYSVGNQFYLWSVLTSYNHGLFLYYPIFALILVIGLIFGRTRLPTAVYGLLLLLYALLYGFADNWWLAGGLGHRGFVELAPLGMPVLAFIISRSRGIKKFAVLILVALCVLITQEMMAGLWNGTLPWEAITSEQYRSHLWGRDSALSWMN